MWWCRLRPAIDELEVEALAGCGVLARLIAVEGVVGAVPVATRADARALEHVGLVPAAVEAADDLPVEAVAVRARGGAVNGN